LEERRMQWRNLLGHKLGESVTRRSDRRNSQRVRNPRTKEAPLIDSRACSS
jgi:hypothetical protein